MTARASLYARSLAFAALSSLLPLLASAAGAAGEEIAMTDARWQVEAEKSEVVTFRGREALYLENGGAVVDGVDLLDGAIEFDVAFDGRRGFSGGLWRIQPGGDAEEFYLRPHQSGNPDASQYTPVVNGLTAWQLYHGPRYAIPVEIDLSGWNHVRIAFRSDEAEITVNGETLFVDELKLAPQSGSVGVHSSFAPAWFAGFRIDDAEPEIAGTSAPPRLLPEHPVRRWTISSAFGEDRVAGVTTLPGSALADLTWREAESESNGLLNLSRWARRAKDADTVLVRLDLVAAQGTVQPIRFGFSDRIRVFLDRRQVFAGDDGYESRDYRFLGTIGLWDTVFLPLTAGRHEVLFAVSESFGGWGLIADLEAAPGVIVTRPPATFFEAETEE